MPNQVVLERTEEAFCGCIVLAVAFPTPAGGYADRREALSVCETTQECHADLEGDTPT